VRISKELRKESAYLDRDEEGECIFLMSYGGRVPISKVRYFDGKA